MTGGPPARRRRSAITIKDVARAADVAPMTVSRVIAGSAAVRPQTRERVEAVMENLGYRPRHDGMESDADRGIAIALLHAGIGSAQLDEFLVGAFAHARPRNVTLTVREYGRAWQQEMTRDEPWAPRVDGVVMSPSLANLPSIRPVLADFGVPAVAVAPGGISNWDMSVRIDGYKAAYAMTSHLAALGHRRIGLVTGIAERDGNRHRLEGYLAALADLGLPDAPELILEGLSTYRSGMDAAEQLLDLRYPPTAIFALDDETAAATIAVAHSHGLEVPSDLTVCGFNDSALAARMWPALTTISQPIAEMVGRAVELVIEAVRLKRLGRSDQLANPHMLADFRLVRRQSDAAPRRRPAALERRAS